MFPGQWIRSIKSSKCLRVLDADELPETLRERVPRMIPVEYANVAEVANIVKEVYHDFLQDNNQRGGRGTNPLELMMSGGRGNSRGGQSGASRRPSAVRMTIGVDTQTSKLVVSASDSLFRQVEDMVADLDKAAKAARRTIHVVNVNESNSAVLQEALTALLPMSASVRRVPVHRAAGAGPRRGTVPPTMIVAAECLRRCKPVNPVAPGHQPVPQVDAVLAAVRPAVAVGLVVGPVRPADAVASVEVDLVAGVVPQAVAVGLGVDVNFPNTIP